MALAPAHKKRLGWAAVVVGSALIAQQLLFGHALSDDASDEPATAAEPRRAGRSEPRTERPALQLDRLDAAPAAASAADDDMVALFEARPWVAPPPPAPPPPPPPKPVAPAFPYTYIGGLLDGDVRTGFFMQGSAGRVLAVHPGDTLDGVYRVDDLSDTQMNLTYLPLNETMAVALRSAR